MDKCGRSGDLLGDGAVEKWEEDLGWIWFDLRGNLGKFGAFILQSVSKKTTHSPTVENR